MFNLKFFKTMKAINVLCISALALFLGSCSNDDDNEEIKGGEGKVVTWDQAFCSKIDIYIDDDGQIYNTKNSKDGITVTMAGQEEYDGLWEGSLYLCDPTSVLTFTSTVGKFKKIEIYEADPIDDPAVPANWRWDAKSSIFTWKGTAAATVTMAGIKDKLVAVGEVSKIVFTLE